MFNFQRQVFGQVFCLFFLSLFLSFPVTAQQGDGLPEIWEPQRDYAPCAAAGVAPFNYENTEVETGTLCDQFGNSDLYVNIAAGAGTTYALNRVIENEYYFVQGTWTIQANQSLTFRNCVFKMAPGAQIKVVCVNTENMTFEGCNFFACDQMWKSIEVTHQFTSQTLGGDFRFNFTNCNVEDATEALSLNNASGLVLYTIMGSHFSNNYVGLSARNANPQRYVRLNATNNHWGTTQNLRPFYSVRTPKYWPLAEAGVVLDGFYVAFPMLSNQFFRMYYGLVATKSIVTVNGGAFTSLWSLGISAKDSRLKVGNGCEFSGQRFVNNQPFMECGIYTEGSDLDISGCTFKKALINGIYSTLNNNAQIVRVYQNTFTEVEYAPGPSQVGIWIKRSAAAGGGIVAAHNDIFSNIFSIQKPLIGSGADSYSAIIIDGLNIASDILYVRDHSAINFTNIREKNVGIAVLNDNGGNCKIINNNITMVGQTHNNANYGIELSTSATNHEVSNNTIIGSLIINPQNPDYKESWQCGLHIGINSTSDVSTLCNNTVDQNYHGLHLTGTKGSLNVKENSMNNHAYGIRIEQSRIGHQDGHGNTWNGTYRVYAAEKSLNIGLPIDSRFWIPESNTLPFLPPPSQLNPNPLLAIDEENKWFKYDVGTPINYCGGQSAAESMGLNEVEHALVTGALQLPEAEQWDAKRQLYLKFLENPVLATSPLAQNFLNVHQQSTVEAFAQVDHQIRLAAHYPLGVQTQREVLTNFIEQYEAAFFQLWEGWGHDPAQASAAELDQWQHISRVIADSFALQQTLDMAWRSQLVASLGGIQILNDALLTNTPQQNARKTLNRIWMGRLQGFPLDQADYLALYAIAFAPDSVVGQMAKQEAANQLATCDRWLILAELEHATPEPRSNSASNGSPAWGVYPNPSTGFVQVNLPLLASQNLQVFDLTGRVVYACPVPADQSTMALDLSRQPNGVYFVQLLGIGQQIPYMAKLVLQH